jgi:hypothetical protein
MSYRIASEHRALKGMVKQQLDVVGASQLKHPRNQQSPEKAAQNLRLAEIFTLCWKTVGFFQVMPEQNFT